MEQVRTQIQLTPAPTPVYAVDETSRLAAPNSQEWALLANRREQSVSVWCSVSGDSVTSVITLALRGSARAVCNNRVEWELGGSVTLHNLGNAVGAIRIALLFL